MVLEPDSTTIIATLLHDVASHENVSYDAIENSFGAEVRAIIEHLDTLSRVKYR